MKNQLILYPCYIFKAKEKTNRNKHKKSALNESAFSNIYTDSYQTICSMLSNVTEPPSSNSMVPDASSDNKMTPSSMSVA